MKTVTIIILCLVGLMAITAYAYDDECNWSCGMDCFDQGLHGECDSQGACLCSSCIYRACRKLCIKQNQIGQCDDQRCLCL